MTVTPGGGIAVGRADHGDIRSGKGVFRNVVYGGRDHRNQEAAAVCEGPLAEGERARRNNDLLGGDAREGFRFIAGSFRTFCAETALSASCTARQTLQKIPPRTPSLPSAAAVLGPCTQLWPKAGISVRVTVCAVKAWFSKAAEV